jgi:hypothetical protein
MGNKKNSIPQVTLVCVAGVQVKKAIYALWRSSLEIDFSSIKLVTNQKVLYKPHWLTIEMAIENPLSSLNHYNHYCIYTLHKHIDSSHALIIQADGYVINAHKWNNSFLKFDYIGAPWKIRSDAYIDPYGNHQRVGNGGFSLRSLKLLRIPLNQKIEWNVNEGTFYKHMNVGEQAEDGIICVHNRHVYESAGCSFAPFEVALNFSREQKIPENYKLQTFGFHKKLYSKKLIITDFYYRALFIFLYAKKKL